MASLVVLVARQFSILVENFVTYVSKDGNVALKEIMNRDFSLLPNFINEDEEKNLMKEIDKSFRRTKYQFDHWDSAIHGFRETEKSNWKNDNFEIIGKIKNVAFKKTNNVIATTHVLDLAENGHIKPHIDSVKFCGTTIAGLNLLSSAVMRFRRNEDPDTFIDILLPSLSLYVMRDTLRFDFTHEVLANEESYWRGEHFPRKRRVSILIRNEP